MFKLPIKSILVAAISTIAVQPLTVNACQSPAYVGDICTFAFNFCPTGFLPANGELLAISQYIVLFDLLGTQFGGDGVKTFGLPNLQGRVPVGTGQGTGISDILIGQSGGEETTTLSVANLPLHYHPASTNMIITSILDAISTSGKTSSPGGNFLAVSSVTDHIYSTSAASVAMAAAAIKTTTTKVSTTVSPTGNLAPFPIREPFTGITYCIAYAGVFPSQN